MNKRQFVQSRRKDWSEFRRLIEKFETQQAKNITASEVTEFSRLMREVSNDLAVIRSHEWGREISDYLNSLVTRGYNNFYAAPPGHFKQFLRFVAFGFPSLLRENWVFFLAGWCLFFVPMFLAWGLIQYDPSLAARVLPPDQLEMMEQMYARPFYGDEGDLAENEEAEELVPVVEGYFDQRSFMAGFYVKNNVGIAFRCFAIGILMGIGTCYVLISNGLTIGAVTGYIIAAGYWENFLSFVVTHGSFELTAIAVSGAAGLMLGDAVIHRRNRTLFDSLKVRGLDAIKIAVGAGAMLVVAAGLEGYWSPSAISSSVKFTVGLTSWVFVYAWLLLAGRGKTA
jgi:uncharacterized membrane protein SpoIIM required for sporulation